MDNHEKQNHVSFCPRCQARIVANSRYCKNCEFDLESLTQVNDAKELGLELNNKMIVKEEKDGQMSYSQPTTKAISINKKINDIILFVVGILAICMCFIPIFSDSNFYTYALQMKESGYKFEILNFFGIDANTRFYDVISQMVEYAKFDGKHINSSMVMFIYEYIVAAVVTVIIFFGIWLLAISIFNFFSENKKKYDKRIIGIILALTLIMVFGLNCTGIGTIVLTIACFGSLMYFYVSSILTKEKKFFMHHLIHKSICAILLLVLLTISSFGLCNLNVNLGTNLYNFLEYPTSGEIAEPSIFYCKGLFYEFMQFVQRSSGDDVYTIVAFIINVFSFVSHSLYIVFTVVAIALLFKSLSKQNVKFPVVAITAATVAFYAFAIFAMTFNQIVNEAMYQKYVLAVGEGNLPGFNILQVDQAREFNKVFRFRGGMIASMILMLPCCIYSFVARNICLENDD